MTSSECVNIFIIQIDYTANKNRQTLSQQKPCCNDSAVLSVRFEVGVSLLLAPAAADKRGLKTPLPLVENARMQPEIRKRVPAGAPVGDGSY